MAIGIMLAGIVAIAAIANYIRKHHAAAVVKLLTATLSATTLAAIAYVPSASAASAPQAPLYIVNTKLTGTVGTPIKLSATGGSGAGKVTYATSSPNCSIIATTGSVTARTSATCSVVATKAAAAPFLAVSSTAVKFTFTGLNQAALTISNTVTTSLAGKTFALTTKGGSGTGAVTYAASGATCSIKLNSLTAAAMTTCSVVATKAGTGAYNSVASAPVVFTFLPATFQIVNSLRAGTVGTPLTVLAQGGTAKGTTKYSTTGTGCSIGAATGALTASQATTCAVSAVVMSGAAKLATAPTVNFGFTVENPTVAHPDVASLTSVTGTAGAQVNNTANGQAQFINQYFNANDHWYVNYLQAGSTTTLNWHVNGSNGLALVGAPVTLHTNLAYSCATGVTWTNAAANVYPGCNGGTEGLLTGTTDAKGNVSFTLVNDNLVGGSAPANMTTAAGVAANESGKFPWTSMLLQVKSLTYTGNPATQINQGTDRVDFVVIPPAVNTNAPTVAHPDVARLTGVTGTTGAQINDTVNGQNYFINQYYNSTDHWYGNYIKNGATVTMTWHVNGSNGKPYAHAPVTLLGNLTYSCAKNVTWETASLNVYPGCGGGAQGSLAGTTDANGNVTFTLHNTNSGTGIQPTDTTTTAGMEANEGPLAWTNMLLQVGSDTTSGNPATEVNQATDRVDFLVIPDAEIAPPTASSYIHPDVATMTGMTGVVNATPIDFTSNGDQWFINSYYSPGDHWNFTYVKKGATITQSWHVVDFSGAAMKNQTVTLMTGTGASWSATGMDADGNIAGTTDSSGNVTFTLTSTETDGGATPANTTDGWTALAAQNDHTNKWSRLKLVIGTPVTGAGVDPTYGAVGSTTDIFTAGGDHLSLVNQATDLVDLIVVPDSSTPPPAPTSASYAHPDVATMTGMTGVVNATPLDYTANGDTWFINDYYSPGDHWNFTYVKKGATITQTWHVVDYSGSVMKSKTVTLMTGGGAAWSATGMDANGNLSGTTDDSGNVTFTLKSTETNGGSAPADITSGDTALAAEGTNAWSRFKLVIGTQVTNAGVDATYGAVGSTSDIFTAGNAHLSLVNQATDLVDLIIVPDSSTPPPAPTASYAHPDVATMTGMTGVVNTTPIDFTSNGDEWFINSYYSPGDHWNFTYVEKGATITQSWHVVDFTGSAMKSQTVTLLTGGGSPWSATGMDANGNVSGTTDSSGNVTFTLTSTESNAGADRPSDLTDGWSALAAENDQTNKFTRFKLVIGTPVANAGVDGTYGAVGSTSDIFTAGNAHLSLVNQATDLVDVIVVPVA